MRFILKDSPGRLTQGILRNRDLGGRRQDEVEVRERARSVSMVRIEFQNLAGAHFGIFFQGKRSFRLVISYKNDVG